MCLVFRLVNTICKGYFDYTTDGQRTNIMNIKSGGNRLQLKGIQKDDDKTHYKSRKIKNRKMQATL